jgi:hypothetical protein
MFASVYLDLPRSAWIYLGLHGSARVAYDDTARKVSIISCVVPVVVKICDVTGMFAYNIIWGWC